MGKHVRNEVTPQSYIIYFIYLFIYYLFIYLFIYSLFNVDV